jgi:hypothetical protein
MAAGSGCMGKDGGMDVQDGIEQTDDQSPGGDLNCLPPGG